MGYTPGWSTDRIETSSSRPSTTWSFVRRISAKLVNGVDRRVEQIIAEIEETDDILIEIRVMPDHVHPAIDVDPQFGMFRWLKSRLPTLWTNSYFVSNVGGAPPAVIKRSIEIQKSV